jgi:Ca2+-binding EF-hand superfamily protein
MRILYCLPLLALPAAAAAQPPAGGPGTERARPRGGGVFISPMGEPFRGAERGEDLIRSWFDGADADHDGKLVVTEMEGDAARFYATLDGDRDGEIDPAEMERYETQIAPELHQLGVMAGLSYRPNDVSMPWRGGPKRRGGRGGGRALSLLNLPQPVASADFNFNRGISAAEFKQAADQRFALLDTNHDGKLEMAELAAYRPSRPPVPAMDQGKGEED